MVDISALFLLLTILLALKVTVEGLRNRPSRPKKLDDYHNVNNVPQRKDPRPRFVQNLTLDLSNSSPAVLDSAVLFVAKLRDYNGDLVEATGYDYIWDDTIKPTNVTHGQYFSSLSRVYRADLLRQGTYSMMVTVVRKDGERVAVAMMDYNLTGHLNGNMTVNQQLPYQRQPDVLSTEQPLLLTTKLSDNFPSAAKKFEYHWYINRKFVGSSDNPQLRISLADPGVKNVTVKVSAKVHTDVFILPRFVNKSGEFTKKITLKDPLSRFKIQGGASVNINQHFYINVTCKGSGPTSLCWDISPLSGGRTNSSCSPTMFMGGCHHVVSLQLSEAGKYHFRARLTNDVSQLERHWYLYVYDPGSVNVPAITVPIVFGVLAIGIIMGGAAYILRLRKKPYVEVADFDFHPSLTREAQESKLTVRIKQTVQSLLTSPTSSKGIPRQAKSTFKDYGSVEEDVAL